MNRLGTMAATCLVTAGPAFGEGFEGPYAMSNWSSSGILGGTTAIAPAAASEVSVSYAVDLGSPGPGVSFRTTTMSVPADVTGSVSFDWHWTAFHAYFQPYGVLQVFADGPSGTTVVTLHDAAVGVPFDLSGSATIAVEEGYDFGIIVGGSNFDSNSQISGTVALSSFTAPVADFSGAYELQNWSSSGIQNGTVAMAPVSGETASAAFSYAVDLGNPGPGVSLRTATFGVPADATGTVSFDWHWTGFHAWFDNYGLLQVFAEGCSGTTVIDLYNGAVGAPFDLTGSATIAVEKGLRFGIIVGGSNYDSTSQLNGTVSVTGFRGPSADFRGPYELSNWSNTGILNGTTAQQESLQAPAAGGEFSYLVDLGNPGPGVTFRSATFAVPADATTTVSFDWHWTGFHAFFMNDGILQVFADGASGTQVFDVYNGGVAAPFDLSGSATIAVQEGYDFGIIVGGSNFDSNSLLSGTVKLTSFSPSCTGDLDGDGSVGIVDLLGMLGNWGCSPGATADLDQDGFVGIVDLLALLAAWGPCL